MASSSSSMIVSPTASVNDNAQLMVSADARKRICAISCNTGSNVLTRQVVSIDNNNFIDRPSHQNTIGR
jgi:hypothetical protein